MVHLTSFCPKVCMKLIPMFNGMAGYIGENNSSFYLKKIVVIQIESEEQRRNFSQRKKRTQRQLRENPLKNFSTNPNSLLSLFKLVQQSPW